MKLISGTANEALAQTIAEQLGVSLTGRTIRKFSDGEILVEVLENVRGEDVFVIQPTVTPVNENMMELLIMLDSLRRASARRITALIPYFGYARQDRKTGPRTPITAKLAANLIETAGADRVLTLDLHAGQIQGFFDVPTDNLIAAPVFADYIADSLKDNSETSPLVVSPDVGGVLRARLFAARIGADIAIIDKRRPRAGEAEVMNVIGDVQGRDCLMIDDIADSAGTLCNGAKALLENGAKSVRAFISHGVLSNGAIERVEQSALTELVITDSIPLSRDSAKIKIISIAPLLSKAILSIAEEKSISSLFD